MRQCRLSYFLCPSDENVLDYLVSQCQTVDDMKKATKPYLGARCSYKVAFAKQKLFFYFYFFLKKEKNALTFINKSLIKMYCMYT